MTALLLATILAPAAPLRAAATPPLKLLAASDHVTLTTYKNQPIPLDLGLYVASPDDDFELRVARPDYDTPMSLTQWIGGVEDRTLDPALLADRLQGLRDFFHVTITTREGEPVAEYDKDFCPASWEPQRTNDEGPDTPRYPDMGCWAMPFTKGVVWGIDHGWAAGTAESFDPDEPLLTKGNSSWTPRSRSRTGRSSTFPPASTRPA